MSGESRIGPTLTLTYQFMDDNNTLIYGTKRNVPLKADDNVECQEILEQIFDHTTVLYNPKNSRKNILYPPFFVKLLPAIT